MDSGSNEKFEFSEEFEKSFAESMKRISEQMDTFKKAFESNATINPAINHSSTTPIINQTFQRPGFIERIFSNFSENHSWTRFSHVSGHYRRSVNGNVHFVRGHSRNTGDFWNWAAWTPLSWLVLPVLFLKLQIHHPWNLKGVVGHLALAAFASLFADLAFVMLILIFGGWIVIKLIQIFNQ